MSWTTDCDACGEYARCKRYDVTSGGVVERRLWCEACHLEASLGGPPIGVDAIVELCEKPAHGDCIRERGHEGSCLFRCCGKACPGLPWPASIAAHPFQCVGDGGVETDEPPEFRRPGKAFSEG